MEVHLIGFGRIFASPGSLLLQFGCEPKNPEAIQTLMLRMVRSTQQSVNLVTKLATRFHFWDTKP